MAREEGEKGMQEAQRIRTRLSGKSLRPTISGTTNRVTNQPHASKRNVKSCQSATKVNIKTVDSSLFFVPPRGM